MEESHMTPEASARHLPSTAQTRNTAGVAKYRSRHAWRRGYVAATRR